MIANWNERLALLTWTQIFTSTFVGVLALGSFSMMFFGLNFWLHSFGTNSCSIYTTLLVPTACWAVLFILPVFGLHILKPAEPLSWAFGKTSFPLLMLIGICDAFSGLLGVYSASHTPMFLQTMLLSTGPVWTFLCCRLLTPEYDRQLNIWTGLCFVLLFVGLALVAVPQISSMEHPSPGVFAWWIIYLMSVCLPPVFNVLQAKYMSRFSGVAASPSTVKTVMLGGDCGVQFVTTLLVWPVDALPWFGSSSSLAESWTRNKSSLICIVTCENNALYMLAFVFGFFLLHISMTFLNQYSPTLGAVIMSMSCPTVACLLLAIPSWNVYDLPASWPYEAAAIVVLLVATVLFILCEESARMQQFRSGQAFKLTNKTQSGYDSLPSLAD
jgi:hypothetical protein